MWHVCVTGGVFFSTYESLSVRMLVSVVQVRTAYCCAMTGEGVSAPHSAISAYPDVNISTARKEVWTALCVRCASAERDGECEFADPPLSI